MFVCVCKYTANTYVCVCMPLYICIYLYACVQIYMHVRVCACVWCWSFVFCFFCTQPKRSGELEVRGPEAAAAAGAWKEQGIHGGEATRTGGQNPCWLTYNSPPCIAAFYYCGRGGGSGGSGHTATITEPVNLGTEQINSTLTQTGKVEGECWEHPIWTVGQMNTEHEFPTK